MSKCKGNGKIHLSDKMTHNEFSLFEDLIDPIWDFFKDFKI